jgi:hypothetical protein
MDSLKGIRETENNPKNPLVWAKKPKKKTKKNPKKQKKLKKQKTHWAGFFLKKHGFFPTLGFGDQKLKYLQLKKQLNIYLIKNCNLPILRPPYRTTKLRRRLQPSKENIQQFKTGNFLIFSIIMGNFCPPGSGYGSTDLMESGSNPDPKHW